MKKAFTLIELLVVIAIIAVLASILFPVFAQAKLAAKGAASISNAAQIGMAHSLYTNDSDDVAVLNGNTDADAPFSLKSLTGSGASTPYKSWGYLMQPYMKNFSVFQDPLTQGEPTAKETLGDRILGYKTQYGYAFTVHSPALFYPSSRQYTYSGRSQQAIAQPAETVLFVEKKSRNGNPDWYWEGSTVWGANVVNPPGCHSDYTSTATTPLSLCMPYNNWGSDAKSYPTQSFEEGGLTGGVSWRRVGRTIVSWTDGHTKAVTPGQLAAGTNWTPSTPSSKVVVTDKDRFVWDAE